MFGVSLREKMLFAEHLALLIKGATPLTEALDVIKQEAETFGFKKVLDDILKQVSMGQTLSYSLSRHPKIFDNFFQHIVKTGEESGTLSGSLKYLSSHLHKQHSLHRKIRAALIYPILVITVATIIVSLITIFVLPKLIERFQGLGAQLPLPTKMLIGGGTFIMTYWMWILGGIVLSFLILRGLQKIESTKFLYYKLILALPVFGKINKEFNLAQLSRTFHTLFKSGVPILEALSICINTTSNQVYKVRLRSIRSMVERGEKTSKEFKQFPNLFPPVFCQMIFIGEKSGNLEETLQYLAEFYEATVTDTIKNLSDILEPLLLILLGTAVAFIALAIVTPIYKLISTLQEMI